ncbi:MAG: hypothetical protein IPK79_06090 [Vampirovibrionales bacterium]|nr:hypothetical protein [Vampirovibrionales bacterium]
MPPALLLQGALLGGLTLFLVFMTSWMALPFHMQGLRGFKDEAAVARVLRDNAPVHGVYMMPGMRADGSPTVAHGLPKVFASVYPPGCSEANMPRYLTLEFLTDVVAAGLLTALLLMAGPLTFRQRVAFSALTGALLALVASAPNWNWWRFTGDYLWPGVIDDLVATTLCGAVIAWLIGRWERRASA